MSISRKVSQHGKSAFSLLEVTLAMGILVLLAGALYAMVDASVRASADLEERQNRTREITEFLGLCRKTFRSLPATAIFQCRVVSLGEAHSQELVFRNAPGLFWWGDAENASISTILGARQQVGGLVGLSILQDTEDEIDSYLNGGTALRDWLALLPDLRTAKWRFYDPRTQTWAGEWKDYTFRPTFVELTLDEGKGEEKYVFWVPPIQPQV